MYAVIFEQKLLYLGHDQFKAVDVFRSNKNAELHCLQNTYDLKNLIKEKDEDFSSHKNLQNSNKINDLFKRLESIDDTLYLEQTPKRSHDKPTEVRYLGHKDMKPVGKGFVCVSQSPSDDLEQQ